MSRDTTVIAFRQPDDIDDPLTELAREGARRMLAQVLIAEADAFVAMWKDLKLPDGRDRIVRHGHGPDRTIQTGVGPVEVRRAKVRDRGDVGTEAKIRFSSAILPKWARRTKSLDALLPVLYLRGVSTGDFQEAFAALLGRTRRTLCLHSSTSLPSTGTICARQTRSRAYSRRSVIEPCGPRRSVGEDRQTHGVQTCQRRRKNLAAIERREPVAKGRFGANTGAPDGKHQREKLVGQRQAIGFEAVMRHQQPARQPLVQLRPRIGNCSVSGLHTERLHELQ